MQRTRLNALEILKQLPRTNCRECRLPTCLAFAAQVAQGLRAPEDCPYLDGAAQVLARDLAREGALPESLEGEALDALTARVRAVDFARVADLVGARLRGGDLVFHCLGREFALDPRGRMRSQCHVNLWVLIPLLDTLVHADDALRAGREGALRRPTGEWIKYDQLRDSVSRSDYFTHRTEQALLELAAPDPDLFADLLSIFGGRAEDHGFGADCSIVLRPLPRVPLLLCYWRPDPPFDAKVGLYFDRSLDHHLSIESVTILGIGLVEMWKRVAARLRFGEEG